MAFLPKKNKKSKKKADVSEHKYKVRGVHILIHPLLFVVGLACVLIWTVPLGHAFMFIAMKAYDFFTQTGPIGAKVKPHWDGLLDNSWWPVARHMLRNGYEGLSVTLALTIVGYNALKPRNMRLNALDKLEIKLHIANFKQAKPLSTLQAVSAVILALTVYSAFSFFITIVAVYMVQIHTHILSAQPTVHQVIAGAISHPVTKASLLITAKKVFMSYLHTWWLSEWYLKIGGMAAGYFFARRPLRLVYYTVHMRFARWRAAKSRSIRWFFPPALKDLILWVKKYPGKDPRQMMRAIEAGTA